MVTGTASINQVITTKTEKNFFQIISDHLAKSLIDSLKSLAGYGAGFIQQIEYWMGRDVGVYDEDGTKWIFNTYGEWQGKYPYLSISQIGRILRTLEKEGYIRSARSSELRKTCPKFPRHFSPSDRTKFYTVVKTPPCKGIQDSTAETLDMTQSSPVNVPTCTHELSTYIQKNTQKNNNTAETKQDSVVVKNDSDLKTKKIQIAQEKPEVEPEVEPEKVQVPIQNEVKPEIQEQTIQEQDEALLQQAEDLGVKLNPQLIKFLLSVPIESFKKGLDVLKSSSKKKKIQNPAGFIRKAVAEGWEVNVEPVVILSESHKAFKEWYESAPKSSEGLLDVPINQLPKDWNNDYMVYLAPPLGRPLGNAPYEMVKWEFARKIVTPQRE